jgi:hypothetical protein
VKMKINVTKNQDVGIKGVNKEHSGTSQVL